MNHSFYSVDRTTHSKIVEIGLMFATTIAGVGIAVHSAGSDPQTNAGAGHISVLKAGKPAMMASGAQSAVR